MIRLSCISLFSTGPTIFVEKNLLVVQAPLPLSEMLVALMVAFNATDEFFKRLYGPHTKRCWPYVSLFLRPEYEIFKIAHNL